MKIDLYTKAVVSIIALCLIWICMNGITPVASAQGDVQRVMIVDHNGTPLINAQGLRVNLGNQPVSISFGNQPVPVALQRIERLGACQPIQVEMLNALPVGYPGK